MCLKNIAYYVCYNVLKDVDTKYKCSKNCHMYIEFDIKVLLTLF